MYGISLIIYQIYFHGTRIGALLGTVIAKIYQVHSEGTSAEIQAQIRDIPGVLAVSPVLKATVPVVFNTSAEPLKSFGRIDPPKTVEAGGEISSTLQSMLFLDLELQYDTMSRANANKFRVVGGVDKLHKLGIKGKDIKIGIIDTGVDYR